MCWLSALRLAVVSGWSMVISYNFSFIDQEEENWRTSSGPHLLGKQADGRCAFGTNFIRLAFPFADGAFRPATNRRHRGIIQFGQRKACGGRLRAWMRVPIFGLRPRMRIQNPSLVDLIGTLTSGAHPGRRRSSSIILPFRFSATFGEVCLNRWKGLSFLRLRSHRFAGRV